MIIKTTVSIEQAEAEEIRKTAHENARLVCKIIQDSYRAKIKGARTKKRASELHSEMLREQQLALQPFVKALAQLPPAPLFILPEPTLPHNPS